MVGQHDGGENKQLCIEVGMRMYMKLSPYSSFYFTIHCVLLVYAAVPYPIRSES